MPLKNRYYKCSKISERKFRQIIRYFAQDFTASDTSRLTSVSIRSINNIYLKLRKRIVQECEQQAPFDEVVEVDESYFGPHRIRGKRGRGAGGKTIVFGIFKRGDKWKPTSIYYQWTQYISKEPERWEEYIEDMFLNRDVDESKLEPVKNKVIDFDDDDSDRDSDSGS